MNRRDAIKALAILPTVAMGKASVRAVDQCPRPKLWTCWMVYDAKGRCIGMTAVPVQEE